jgi:hypothetical protein
MTTSALRPRSPSEIVDAAFQILRAHYAQFVMCAAIAYVPMLIVKLVVIGDPRRALASGDVNMLGTLGSRYVSTSIFGVITLTLMSAVLVVCTSQAYLGEEVDVGVAVRRVMGRLPVLIVATILTWMMLIVALIFLIFPVLYVAAVTFAVIPAIMLEDSVSPARSAAPSSSRTGASGTSSTRSAWR